MVKKEITFVYSDSVEKQVFEMIAKEAEKRDYTTKLTTNIFAKCEIGWYCQHINFPQYSKFSIIMLHDLTQQYGYWPDLWYREPWNKYDIGFLPNNIWVENWMKCSSFSYSHPRKGVFLTGWPKADRISLCFDEKKKNEYKKQIGLNPEKATILYAPAWENDGKQDEFVKAVLPLDVNVLIKQAPWGDAYPDQIKNVAEMRALHQDNERIIQLDPRTNILDAIMVSDVLVSEESSTMLESVMMGKPAISVCDWLIPDTTPSRFPSGNYDFVVKTVKENLTITISDILSNYTLFSKEAQNYSKSHFSNIGRCIPMMLDILDAYLMGEDCIYKPLKGEAIKPLGLQKAMGHFYIKLKREISHNYCERNFILNRLYHLYKKVCHKP